MEIAGVRSFNELSAQATGPAEDEGLGRTQFLELMIAQLENQDPLNPAENQDFIAQLAQFSSVEGIQNLNDSFDGVVNSLQSSLSLQAASLVGRGVLSPADTALYEGGNLSASINLPEAVPSLQVDIQTSDGVLLRQLDLGPQPAGVTRFVWDGQDELGNVQEAGLYQITAFADGLGERRAVAANLPNRVAGVTLGDRGVVANLVGGAEVATFDIAEIR